MSGVHVHVIPTLALEWPYWSEAFSKAGARECPPKFVLRVEGFLANAREHKLCWTRPEQLYVHILLGLYAKIEPWFELQRRSNLPLLDTLTKIWKPPPFNPLVQFLHVSIYVLLVVYTLLLLLPIKRVFRITNIISITYIFYKNSNIK